MIRCEEVAARFLLHFATLYRSAMGVAGAAMEILARGEELERFLQPLARGFCSQENNTT